MRQKVAKAIRRRVGAEFDAAGEERKSRYVIQKIRRRNGDEAGMLVLVGFERAVNKAKRAYKEAARCGA